MNHAKYYQCTECAKSYPLTSIINLCPDCNRPLEVKLDLDNFNTHPQGWDGFNPDLHSMWRYGPLLPLDINDAVDSQYILSCVKLKSKLSLPILLVCILKFTPS